MTKEWRPIGHGHEPQNLPPLDQVRRGWAYKFFQGRHGMERTLCRPCINELTLAEREWANQRKHAKELERGDEGSTYAQMLCDVD